MTRAVAVLASLLLLAPAARAAERVAVVVAVGEVPGLPPEAQLPDLAPRAKDLARVLEERAGFDRVYVMVDALATSDAVTEALTTTAPAAVDPGGTLLWVFLGHGVGADFGDPHLITYDANLEDLEGTTVRVYDLARRLGAAVQDRSLAIVTDASHGGQVGDLALIGPDAKSWPSIPGDVFVLSLAGAGQSTDPAVTMPILVDAFAGKADLNGDRTITASELHRHLLGTVTTATADANVPAESGAYPPSLPVASMPEGVAPVAHAASGRARRDGFGGPISYALVGTGLVSGAVGVWAYTKGLALCEGEPGARICPNTSEYLQYRTIAPTAGIAGVVLGGTGIGLAFVPLRGGQAWSVGGRF